jgi:hypothetical protein
VRGKEEEIAMCATNQRIGLAVAVLGLVVGTAQRSTASVVVYMSRNSFNAAVSGLSPTVQTFDTFAPGTTFANGATIGGVTYNSSSGMSIVTNAFLALSGSNTLGRTPTQFFAATDTLTLSFPNPISGFGISFNTFATSTGAYTLSLNTGDVVNSFYDPFPGFATGQFAGFTSTTPITSLVISAPGGFSFTLDNLTTVAAVPEPATLAPAISGVLLCLGYARLRGRAMREPA